MALGHPDRPHGEGPGGVHDVVTEDELGGTPAEVDDEVRRLVVVEVGGRTGEAQRGLLLTRDDVGVDAQPGPDARDERVAVGDVAGRGRRDEADGVGTVPADELGGAVERGEGALERLGRERPRAVDTLTEADDLHRPLELVRRPRDGVDVGHEQAQRVRAAVERRDPPGARAHASAGVWGQVAGQPPSAARRSSVSSPIGLTPGPAARACPTRACRHFTRVGIPPQEMPAISGTSASPRAARRRSRSSWARW